MLQLAHKYYRSVLGIFFITIIGISMLFFGVDFGGRSQDTYAIKINETEVGYDELNRRIQERELQLERALGENYRQFAAQLLQGVQQQVIDEIINENLLHQAVLEEGMAPGKEFVKNLLGQLFQGNFSMEKYQALLQQIQTSAPVFEERLASETLSLQLRGLMRHVSLFAPDALTEQLFRERETKYSLTVLSLSPDTTQKNVETPDDATLEQFFTSNLIEYEVPAQIRATYTRFPAEKYRSDVVVLEEDIEAYYLDHEREFRIPAQARIREIVLPLKEDDISEQLKIEGLADELTTRLAAGEDFVAIAKEHSQDELKGQPSEWINRGAQGVAFDSVVFATETPLNTPTRIATGKEIRIVEVLERTEDSLKPLDEVRSTIEERIRLADAPIYAAERARTLFEGWQTGETPLEELLKEEGLTLEKTENFISMRDVKSGAERAIMKSALEQVGIERLLVDIGNELALVFIEEYREPEVPAFETVRETVLEQYRKAEAPAKAREMASDAALFLREETETTPSEKELTAKGFSVKTFTEKKVQELREAPFSDPSVQQALVSRSTPGLLPMSPIEVNGTQYIIRLDALTPPEESAFDEQQEELMEQSSQRIARLLESSLVAHLKSQGDIDIAPAVFNR